MQERKEECDVQKKISSGGTRLTSAQEKTGVVPRVADELLRRRRKGLKTNSRGSQRDSQQLLGKERDEQPTTGRRGVETFYTRAKEKNMAHTKDLCRTCRFPSLGHKPGRVCRKEEKRGT